MAQWLPNFSFKASAATTFVSADGLYNYQLDNNNNATITKYKGSDLAVSIPPEIDGYTVMVIGYQAFYQKTVTSVNIPDTVNNIDSYAFYGCKNLATVYIPSTINGIGEYAFYGCSSLSSVTIPTAMEVISRGTFNSCSSLTEVVIPDNITEIGSYAFSGCGSLNKVTLSAQLSKLGGCAFGETAISEIQIPKSLDDAWCEFNPQYDFVEDGKEYSVGIVAGPFYRCENLKTVTFQNGTTQIADALFAGCVGLEKIVIPDTVTVIEENAFRGCVRLKDLTIGNAVTKIERCAFQSCVLLPEVEIPNSVTEIREYAFSECWSLGDVTLSTGLTKLGGCAFRETAISEIHIPKSLDDAWHEFNPQYDFVEDGKEYSVGIAAGPFYLCENLKTVTFQNGTTQIADTLFAGCVGLEKIVIPDTVTVIEENAFRGCVRLKDLTIGNAVTKIERYAFQSCILLPEVEIPNSVTEVREYAFSGCWALEEVTLSTRLSKLGGCAFGETAISEIQIPKSLDDAWCEFNPQYDFVEDGKEYSVGIAAGPFYLCENLKTVTFQNGTTQIADSLFAGCVGLEKIVIPDTVTVIEENAFRGCVRLKDLTIGNAVTKIDRYAFQSCILLPEVQIPNSVTEIQEYAFSSCWSLASIVIPDAVTKIGNRCFLACASLESAVLSNNIVTILEATFEGCKNLKSIVIPNAVTTIGGSTFKGCTSLATVTFSEVSRLKEVRSSAFENCTSLKEIILPKETKKISDAAFRNCVSLEKVSIPQSTKEILAEAFRGCELLSDVTIADYSIEKLETAVFKDCPSLRKITLPKGLKTIGQQAFVNNVTLVEVVIPESVTSIDSTAFSYPDRMVIFGRPGSVAETFAAEGEFVFIDASVPTEGLILKDGVDYVTMEVGETYRAEFETYPDNTTDVILLFENNGKLSIKGHDLYAQYSGDTVVTATATSGLTYEFTVHVRGVRNITIDTNPDRTTYSLGDAFDTTGMVVLANYTDGSTRVIEDYTIENFDSSVEGDNTVTIKWVAANGSVFSTRLQLEIVDTRPKLTGIFVDVLPTKQTYLLRETLDVTGMVVKGNYTDGYTRVVTDYTLSGYNALKQGEQTITVMVGEFTDTFTVLVERPAICEHKYDNDCDTICNICREIREITHKYEWVVDKVGSCNQEGKKHEECVVCRMTRNENTTTPPTENHQYDHACDSICNTCGVARTITHNYEWVVDLAATCGENGRKHEECTVCHETRNHNTYVFATGNHLFEWVVDKAETCGVEGKKHEECTICNAIQSVDTIIPVTGQHIYANDMDVECNVCGDVREIHEHIYDNACAIECNICHQNRELPDCPGSETPHATFTVESTTGNVGDTVTVAVRVERNPGIAALAIEIGFDNTVLELISVDAKDFTQGLFSVSPTGKNPVRVVWNDINEVTTDGVVAVLTFRIRHTATFGETAVTVAYSPAEVYDLEMNDVHFAVQNGTVTVVDYVLGDLDGNGLVDNRDLGLLLRYVSDWDVDINTLAADVNGDGSVNNQDLGILLRYVSDWDIVLK